MDKTQIDWISDFIWNIADDVLRDVYVRGKYRDVILPFTVLRRLDAVLEPTKDAVLKMKQMLDDAGVSNQEPALRNAADQAFFNTSQFSLVRLKSSSKGQQLRDNFGDYLDGFSPNVLEILDKFKFRNQVQTLVDADILGTLIERFLDPTVNLSNASILDEDGKVLPHATDAWIDADSTKIGYEISFARYFYRPKPLRTLDEIRADILALESQTEGLLHNIVGGGA